MSDNELDVDAELLALAGDGSDDEGDVSAEEVQDRQPSEEAKPSVEQVDHVAPSSRKGVAQKVRAKRRRRKADSAEEEVEEAGEDEEEGDDRVGDGDASPSPPQSLGSDVMDESDGGADGPTSPPDNDDDAPLFPLEGKYVSARDRDEILALPEIRREEILAERAAEVTKRQQDIHLKKALAVASAAANKYKRKAAAADLDDAAGTGKRTTRPKAEKPRSALDDYKRARELKGTERGRLDSTRSRKDQCSPSSAGSDRDAEGESDVEWAEPASDPRHGRDDAPAELKDFERCRIGRSNFAKVCFYPKFEESIKGCFCRVSIGLNRETGQNQYRMTQIKGFTNGKPYALEAASGKHFQTDQYAIVTHGQAEKPWPFSACSDSKFMEAEFDRYLSTLQKEHLRMPSRKYLENKLGDIHGLLNMNWDDKAISEKLRKQRDMERKLDPATAATFKRETVEKRKLEAEEVGDAEEAMRCDAELAALSNSTANLAMNGHGSSPSSGLKASPAAKKTAITMQQERLAQLNMKNRGKNAEEVRRALIEEKKKVQLAREQALADAKAKAAAEAAKRKAAEEAKLLAVPKPDMSDLFGEGSDLSRAGTPVNGVGTPRRSRAGTPLNGLKKEKSALGLGGIKKKNMDEEVIGNLDLGIDVEI